MIVMAIGDVVGSIGCEFLSSKLPALKRLNGVDTVIVNGENSADGNGITPVSAQRLFDAGADVITTGNHAFRRREMYELFDSHPYIVRPANFPKGSTPGHGFCTLDYGKYQVNVINLMGTIYLDSLDCPFKTVDAILKDNPAKINIVDFHAEATSEKQALAFYLDGRVSCVFGTHTHVQTADEHILSGGTGYITDVGMTGPYDSVLGVKKEIAIRKMITKMPERFETATGECMLNCVLFEIDEKTGKTVSVKRLDVR